jgi:hypothetical protein
VNVLAAQHKGEGIMKEIPLLSTVARMEDIPESNLTRGQIGTVVEYLQHGADEEGRTDAMLPLPARQFLVLHGNRAA